MITAKANRISKKESRPTREDYVCKEKPNAGFLPVAFLMVLGGLAVYLKSFLPVRVEASPDQTGKKSPNDEPDRAQHENQDLDADSESDITGSVEKAPKGSGNVVPIPARFTLPPETIDGFLASDSPPIDFSALRPVSLPPIGSATTTAPVRASNDNQSAAQPKSAGGGGGGGGGEDPHYSPKNPKPPELARNRAPRTNGPVHLQDMIGCHAYLISVLALLEGAVDPDGDQLRLGNLSISSGTLRPAEGGGWIYTPEQGMFGEVTLIYYITDGTEIVRQTASFRVLEVPPIVGTNSDDNLIGTRCADVIDGRDGDDNIDAKDGNDVVVGGDGSDHVIAGAGNDTVYAGGGDDLVLAGSGNDILFGGAGRDRLFGEGGDDTIYGEDGDDLVVGGDGADLLIAGPGNDIVQGDGGQDTLDGGTGHDVLRGGSGRDVIYGREGHDTVFGDQDDDVISDGGGEDEVHAGDGHDYILAAADSAADSYAGDSGEDTLDYSSAILNIVVDVDAGTADGLDIGRDLISGFEKIIGGHGDDHLISGAATMTGGEGDDTFEFKVTDTDHQPDLVRKITDFTIGDRVIVASYEIRYQEGEIGEAINDLFNDIYLSNESDHRPVRFRFEKLADADRTFIDVHSEGSPDFYSIELFGRHHLEVTVAVS